MEIDPDLVHSARGRVGGRSGQYELDLQPVEQRLRHDTLVARERIPRAGEHEGLELPNGTVRPDRVGRETADPREIRCPKSHGNRAVRLGPTTHPNTGHELARSKPLSRQLEACDGLVSRRLDVRRI